jgi:exosome complex component RRP42
MIFIDIHIIDYDGNLFDVASLAALAALYNAKVPMERLKGKLEKLQEKCPAIATYLKNNPKDFSLPMRDPPISCTFVKFNDAVVIDPSMDEQEIAESRITVATDSEGHIRAMQKGLNGSFSADEIKKIIKDSFINGRELRSLLKRSAGI